MQFVHEIFQSYVMNYTSQATRSRWNDSIIADFELSDTEILAKVQGSSLYTVKINYTLEKVKKSSCSCPFEGGPVCKHIVNVLKRADSLFEYNDEKVYDFDDEMFIDNLASRSTELRKTGDSSAHPVTYVFENFDFSELTNTFILKHSLEQPNDGKRGFFDLHPLSISYNYGSFTDTYSFYRSEIVTAEMKDNSLILSCKCKTVKRKLCDHQVQLLYNIKDREEIRVFFDLELRKEKIRTTAAEYGLENEENLDDFFDIEYVERALVIKPEIKELLPINSTTTNFLKKHLLPIPAVLPLHNAGLSQSVKPIIVFGKHRYYDHIFVEFLEAKVTKDGGIKNPIVPINPLDYIWKTDKMNEIKFYSGLAKFQNTTLRDSSGSDIDALKAIIANPQGIEAYYQNPAVSDKITVSSIVPVKIQVLDSDLLLTVNLKDKFYEISGKIEIGGKSIEIRDVNVKFNYFILTGGVMYLIDNPNFIRVIEFFKKNNPTILIHESKFVEFQETILSNLEKKIKINYSYLKSASKAQIKEYQLDEEVEKRIYLSDSEDFVLITPIVKYGTIEIPVLSQQQIYKTDRNGNSFTMQRDEELEVQFISRLIRQHDDFEDQIGLDHFYLHKQQFLDEAWFLDVFAEWQENNIRILGFSQLKNNRYNQHKMSVSVSVSSGLDWFDTSLQVRFGDQNVSLKQLQKSIKNNHKYVELGDGTIGLLPEEWIEKFSGYFRTSEIVKDTLRTPKMSFSEISELYDEEMLTAEVQDQLAMYKSKLVDFDSIREVEVPVSLNATLRDYQKQGLNWLNFLDEFEFGGCLADDMGLGKTIQIIAFILSQRDKNRKNTNLIVVPTTLIFNWQSEVQKFAPSIKIHTVYGTDRIKNTDDFDGYEIILTTYGTLISDIRFLKEYAFNYIFLDESQAIKNPESQRYKAVRLLKSRNKVALTGTPIENNTFDLYGQFSFACPGLLGTKQHFKDHFSIPIDKFKETKRAMELQKKINPFLLRRTKAQVAKELPDKTEMVIYCEMGEEQRRIYDAYKQEFREFLMASSNQKKQMDTMYMLAGLTKLRQICDSPSLLDDQQYYGDSSAKIDVLVDEIVTRSPHHKMIVFSQFVTMLDLIKKELIKRKIPFEYLTGQTKDRSSKVEEFQTNSEVRVFLISLKAGGTGLNLTEADYVYLVDPWWNPAVENQAIDRCYRIGQKKNVVAVRLITPNTIEEKIMKLQDSKKELANDLVRTDSSILKSLSKKDLLGLI